MGTPEIIKTLEHVAVAFFTGLLKTTIENLTWIIAIIFFLIASWTLETSRLVMGKAPKPKNNRENNKGTMGTLDLVLVMLFLPGLISSLIGYPLLWVAGSSVIDRYTPAILTFSVITVLIIFELAEAKDGKYVSTGLEWILLSAMGYPDELKYLILGFPLVVLLGRFDRPRNALRKVSPVVSALWLGLGFVMGVFPPMAILWLGSACLLLCATVAGRDFLGRDKGWEA
ncbi:hypothetical protein [Thermococcus sp.]|uniref:hypothetical protein n=1 Tax=Thermococcus sp. TaxID=35749 RepID=UPI002602D117|nr:hypothetical protein [Thermococcus sp.]